MPQLLVELFSEEIPARMQAQAARDLQRLVAAGLDEAGLRSESLRAFAGPRRLALVAEGMPAGQADRQEERKGPRVGAPPAAIDGFLRSTGVDRSKLIERDGLFFACIDHRGRPAPEIIPGVIDTVVRSFPWPKSMTWGSGSLRWVRPLKRILCVFDGSIVPFEIEGVHSGDQTWGHRFMGPGLPLQVRDFNGYLKLLRENFVVLDSQDRMKLILARASALCAERGLELVPDEGLLAEVAGLVEWPTPILGRMDPDFLDLPAEVIRTSMRNHQKYFAVRKTGQEGLAPYFVAVANIEARDGGAMVAAGNARVLSARLRDARFFWDEDARPGNFERWLERLQGVTFHAKLGSMAARAQRLENLAVKLASLLGTDEGHARRAAGLAKADLASLMVGEFPELQGVMGGYYARRSGLPAEIADAISSQYRPQGPSEAVPSAPVSVVVALADKLDLLVSFFRIGEKPTGSRDPYGLRRAALGVIRIILENRLRVGLRQLISDADANADADVHAGTEADELTSFFIDRLKVSLREQGRRHDLVDAVLALGDDDLVRVVSRVDALDAFLSSEDGANLLAGYRRGVNILKAESKKHPGESYAGAPEAGRFTESEERALSDALTSTLANLEPKLRREDFTGAMASLAGLREPVDAFFDRVLVNDPDPVIRLNRLRLLSQVREAAETVADFSSIAG